MKLANSISSNGHLFLVSHPQIVKESDNNVKLIVLDRLVAMKDSPAHERVLQELVMDVLRVLASPDLEVQFDQVFFSLSFCSTVRVT